MRALAVCRLLVIACTLALPAGPVWAAGDPPIARDDTAATNEDTSVDIIVLSNDSDPEGEALTIISISNGPAHGTAVVKSGPGYQYIEYTPAPNWNGTDTFDYTIQEGAAGPGTDTATVTVTVNDVQDPPDAVDDSYTIDEGGALNEAAPGVLGNDSDPDGDAIPVSAFDAIGTAGGAVAVNLDGSFTYTPPHPDWNGTDTFSYTITDGNGNFDTATVTVTVNPVNDDPVANDDAATTDEDTPVTIDVLANDTDVDGDTLTVDSVTQGAHGAVANNGTDVTYTPDPNWNGVDTFTYTVSDGNGGTDTATVTVTVNPVNDAPDAVDDSYTIAEGTVLNEAAPGVLGNDTDVDGDLLSVVVFQTPSNQGGTVVMNPDGSFTYTPPDPDWYGTDTFTYVIGDGNGGGDTGTVTVTVTNVPDPPAANDDEDATDENTPVDISVLANDSDADNLNGPPDEDPLTITSVTSPGHGTAVIIGSVPNQMIRYTPDPSYHGWDTFQYTLTDANGLTASATVDVLVVNVLDPPTAEDDAATTPEDTPVDIDVLDNDTDPMNAALHVVQVFPPSHGTAQVLANGRVRYTPEPNWTGTDTFAYMVSNLVAVDIATVEVTVLPVNDSPVAVDDSAATNMNAAVDIPVLANDTDVDGDALSIQSFTQGAHGTVSQLGAQLRYTPNAFFTGTDTFTYTVSDGHGGTDSATVTVTVNFVPFDVIIDNPAATLINKWTVVAGGGCWGANYALGGSSKSIARYRPNLPVAGLYDVYLWYVADAKKGATAAVKVFQSSVPQTHAFAVDQRLHGSKWVHIGRFPFLAGEDGYVEIQGKKVCADAVKFTCVGPLP